MKSDSTTVIKNMEFLVKELHKEWVTINYFVS